MGNTTTPPAILDGTGFDPKAINEMMGKIGHGGFLGMNYSGHGADWVELMVDWREDLVGDPDTGVMASAVVISLLDNATSMSIWQKNGAFVPQVTMDLRLDYLRPSPSGRTRLRARHLLSYDA